MKYIWLGQAGFVFETSKGTSIMIDPYMSNHLEEEKGPSFHREVPIEESFIFAPDVLALTHCHDDHTDLYTLDKIIGGKKRMHVLAPRSVIPMLKERYGAAAEYVVFEPETEISLYDLRLISCAAVHSDPYAIGIIIEADGKSCCHMGDTLYSRKLFSSIPKGPDLLILPINGKGNNMNARDAARMTRELMPRKVCPIHWDMFKQYGCDPKEFTDEFDGNSKIELALAKHYTENML